MLAIGRALMSKPRLLLLDEPSLGLAPIVIQQIFDTIEQLRQKGMTIFLVEQNANQALKLADRGYVLENGHVVLQDTGRRPARQPGSAAGLSGRLTHRPCMPYRQGSRWLPYLLWGLVCAQACGTLARNQPIRRTSRWTSLPISMPMMPTRN